MPQSLWELVVKAGLTRTNGCPILCVCHKFVRFITRFSRALREMTILCLAIAIPSLYSPIEQFPLVQERDGCFARCPNVPDRKLRAAVGCSSRNQIASSRTEKCRRGAELFPCLCR